MFRHPFFVLWSCLCGIASAQDVPQHRLRILTVGDPPPFVQQVRDGIRYEVPPAPETIPPRTLVLPVPSQPGKAKESEELKIRLRLGQSSAPMVFPLPENHRVDLKSENGGSWLGVPLLPCGSSLAIVWRGSDWTKVNSVVIPDDNVSRAEGNLHFSNVSAFPVGLTIAKEKVRLNPGMSYTRKLPSDKMTPLEVSYFTSAGDVRLCHSAALEPCRGTFRRLVIYSADGRAPRNPIKVLQIEEPSIEPVPPAVTAR